MWLMLNDAYLSIVSKDCKRDELLVRARRPGDIEKIFPNAKVTELHHADYQFRAVVKRSEIKQAMSGEIDRITYGNFKDSVSDQTLHNAYLRVWSHMSLLQPVPPYSGARSRLGDLTYEPSRSFLDQLAPGEFGVVNKKVTKRTKKGR